MTNVDTIGDDLYHHQEKIIRLQQRLNWGIAFQIAARPYPAMLSRCRSSRTGIERVGDKIRRTELTISSNKPGFSINVKE